MPLTFGTAYGAGWDTSTTSSTTNIITFVDAFTQGTTAEAYWRPTGLTARQFRELTTWTVTWDVSNANGAVPVVDFRPEIPPIVLKRAERILTRMLTAKQRAVWERSGIVFVPSPSVPGRAYRISRYGMLREYVDGRPTRDLCIHENEGLPPADRVLALKALIQAEEPEFLKVAIVHRLPTSVRDALPLRRAA